ncbi:MAG: hypothetical protein Tsb002_15070 [Wenzhouxiangellaceae bacterium]
MTRIIPLLLLLAGISFSAAAQAANQDQGEIIAHQSLTLPPPPAQTRMQLSVTMDQRPWLLELSDNTLLLNRLPTSLRQQLQMSGQRYLAGRVAGVNNSWARLWWDGRQWSGGFYADGALWLIESHSAVAGLLTRNSAAAGDHVLFRYADLRLPWRFDDSGEDTFEPTDADAFFDHLHSQLGGDLEQLRLTIVTDTQFNGIHGANTAGVVAGRINFIDGIYTAQVGVTLALFHLEQLTSNGTMTATDSATLLNQFRTFMTTGNGSSIPRDGVSHLFTGRDMDGSTVGRAYLGVLCSNSFGYGINQQFGSSTIAALIVAHELGHNFDAPHDGEDECVNEPFNGIMNPSINGSTQFSDCSLVQMANEVASANCLIPVQQTIYSDGFE